MKRFLRLISLALFLNHSAYAEQMFFVNPAKVIGGGDQSVGVVFQELVAEYFAEFHQLAESNDTATHLVTPFVIVMDTDYKVGLKIRQSSDRPRTVSLLIASKDELDKAARRLVRSARTGQRIDKSSYLKDVSRVEARPKERLSDNGTEFYLSYGPAISNGYGASNKLVHRGFGIRHILADDLGVRLGFSFEDEIESQNAKPNVSSFHFLTGIEWYASDSETSPFLGFDIGNGSVRTAKPYDEEDVQSETSSRSGVKRHSYYSYEGFSANLRGGFAWTRFSTWSLSTALEYQPLLVGAGISGGIFNFASTVGWSLN